MQVNDFKDFYLFIPLLYAFLRYVLLYRKEEFKKTRLYFALAGIIFYVLIALFVARICAETIVLILSMMSVDLMDYSRYIFIVLFVIFDFASEAGIKKYIDLPKDEKKKELLFLFYKPLTFAIVGFLFQLISVLVYLVWFSFAILKA